jgi:hypothetical protein
VSGTRQDWQFWDRPVTAKSLPNSAQSRQR